MTERERENEGQGKSSIIQMTKLAWRHHFPIISLLDTFKHSRASNSIVSDLIIQKIKLLQILCTFSKPASLKRSGSIATKKK